MGNAFERVSNSCQKMHSSLQAQYGECLKDYLELCYRTGKDPNKSLIVRFTKRHQHAVSELVKLKGQCAEMIGEMKLMTDTTP